MMIACTQKEYSQLIRRCEQAQILDQYPCNGCLMRGFCPDDGGIEDSGIVEVIPEEGVTV